MNTFSANSVDALNLLFIKFFHKNEQLLSIFGLLLYKVNSIDRNFFLNQTPERIGTEESASESSKRVVRRNDLTIKQVPARVNITSLLNELSVTLTLLGSILDKDGLKPKIIRRLFEYAMTTLKELMHFKPYFLI